MYINYVLFCSNNSHKWNSSRHLHLDSQHSVPESVKKYDVVNTAGSTFYGFALRIFVNVFIGSGPPFPSLAAYSSRSAGPRAQRTPSRAFGKSKPSVKRILGIQTTPGHIVNAGTCGGFCTLRSRQRRWLRNLTDLYSNKYCTAAYIWTRKAYLYSGWDSTAVDGCSWSGKKNYTRTL